MRFDSPLDRFFVLACSTVAMAGCAVGAEVAPDDTTEVALGALEEVNAITELAALSRLAFASRASAFRPGSGPSTPAERVLALQRFVTQALTCAETSARADDPSSLTVTLSKGCEWAGKTWEGALYVSYTSEMDTVITWDSVSVDGATVTGELNAWLNPEGGVFLSGTRSVTRDDAVVTTTVNAEISWTDESVVVSSATFTRSDRHGEAALSLTDLIWIQGDAAPQTGTVAWTRDGRTWTVSFSVDESGQPMVEVVRPEGNRDTHKAL